MNEILVAIVSVVIFHGYNTRLPMTDGLNSIAHVIIGIIANKYITWCYLFYQISQHFYGLSNTSVDIFEFMIGWIITQIFKK